MWVSSIPDESSRSKAVLVFYDGDCGLCDRFVFWLWQKTQTKAVFFSPLSGDSAKSMVPKEFRTVPYRTVVVVTPEGAQLIKSQAVFYLLETIYPERKTIIKAMTTLLPKPAWDLAYDALARIRSLWGSPRLCNQIPAEQIRKRWLP